MVQGQLVTRNILRKWRNPACEGRFHPHILWGNGVFFVTPFASVDRLADNSGCPRKGQVRANLRNSNRKHWRLKYKQADWR